MKEKKNPRRGEGKTVSGKKAKELFSVITKCRVEIKKDQTSSGKTFEWLISI